MDPAYSGLFHQSGAESGSYDIEINWLYESGLFWPIPAHSVTRAVFCTAPGQEVVILMTVVKKSSQIPKGLFDTAQRRMKEVRTDE